MGLAAAEPNMGLVGAVGTGIGSGGSVAVGTGIGSGGSVAVGTWIGSGGGAAGAY